jgi:RNA polymerase sigma factor (sigma-70 family)
MMDIRRPAIAAHRWNVWLSTETVADRPPWARPWPLHGAGNRGRRRSSPAAVCPAIRQTSILSGFDFPCQDNENPLAMQTAVGSGKLAAPPVDSSHLYVSQLDVIERAMAAVCWRYRLLSVDAEDFRSIARIHLIEDDYGVLRRYQGRSSLQTYLVVVIQRQYQDWCDARWGKWRPSAEANRLGSMAVHLERLIGRDGLSFEEAYETLRTNFRVIESRKELEAVAARFPRRSARPNVVSAELPDTLQSPQKTDAGLEQERAELVGRRVMAVLARAFAALPAQDRLVLRMHFRDGTSIAGVARTLRLDQKQLNRRLPSMLRPLKRALEAAGFDGGDIANLFETGGFEF